MNMERYQRQIALPEIGEEGQALLSQARVLIVGVGGLGSPIALYLAGAGVGCLGLVDDDCVSLSNLQRQILYTEQEVGQPKALCAARRLFQLNSSITIHPYPQRLTAETIDEILCQYDLVVDGCDNFATRFLINDHCAKRGIPYIYGGICGFEGQVSVFPNDGTSRSSYRTLYPDEAATLAMPHPSKAVIGVTPGIVGCVEAAEAIKLICHVGEPLVDRLWTIDLRTMQTYLIDL